MGENRWTLMKIGENVKSGSNWVKIGENSWKQAGAELCQAQNSLS